MNVLFFNSRTFLTKEVENALRKRLELNVHTVDIPQYPDSNSIENIISQISNIFPAIVFSINDAGFDYQGKIQNKLIEKGCYIVNWYHDNPFYEEIFHGRRLMPAKERIDLVSEECFVKKLRDRNFNSYFLPLATDPTFFSDSKCTLERDLAFVGNSSSLFIDSLVTEKRSHEVEKVMPLLSILKKNYYSDTKFNINEFLIKNKPHWQGKTNLRDEELLFILEWLCGYFYRRDFIVSIANRFKQNFTCFGDANWKHFINPLQVSTEACYYTTLQNVYKSSRINLNVNRVQIRTSFTQRIFDCSACGAFILTDKRKLNNTIFTTTGSNKNLVQFSSLEECCALIDYYLLRDEERKEISERAKLHVLKNHTYDNRIDTIINLCHEEWKV